MSCEELLQPDHRHPARSEFPQPTASRHPDRDGKAPEGWRTPGRWRESVRAPRRGSVRECGSPLPLSDALTTHDESARDRPTANLLPE